MPLAVVIPTLDERENVARLLPAIRALLPDAAIYVVDDASPDGTAGAARALGEALGGVTVIERPGRQGLASAYVTGFGAALADGADRLVQMDADLSHDPADLPRLLAPDADLVLGSRYVPGGGTRNWPWYRRFLSRGGSAYARLCTGAGIHDLTGGYKAWRAPALRAALATPLRGEGYVFQVEMTRRALVGGASVVEVPILFTERVDGTSKLSFDIAIEAAWTLPRLGRVRR